MTRSRRARLGRALENTSALHLTGRTWDDPFDGDPDVTEKELVVEVEPFPTDRHGTITILLDGPTLSVESERWL